MTRKNTWLPGGSNFGNGRPSDEPGTKRELREWGNTEVFAIGSHTPLLDVVQAVVLLVVATAVAVWAFARATPLNLGASIILIVALALALGGAIWLVRRAIVRQSWRRKNVALNGGTLIRAWQSTPRGLNKPRD